MHVGTLFANSPKGNKSNVFLCEWAACPNGIRILPLSRLGLIQPDAAYLGASLNVPRDAQNAVDATSPSVNGLVCHEGYIRSCHVEVSYNSMIQGPHPGYSMLTETCPAPYKQPMLALEPFLPRRRQTVAQLS